jgi:hypothetical protein
MDNFERAFLNLRYLYEHYKNHGIDQPDFTESYEYLEKAKESYLKFRKKTGILNIYK